MLGSGALKERPMSETELDDTLAETEIVRWSPKRGPLIGSGPSSSLDEARPDARPALAVGALALGVAAVGALAIGAIAIGRLVVGSARIRDLKIGRLVVDELVVKRRRGSL
jgi:hypothetical protein